MNKEELLKKYYDGETSLQEEQWLREQNWLLDELNVEHLMFSDIKNQSAKNSNKKQVSKIRRLLPYIISGTAAACLVFFVWLNLNPTSQQVDDPNSLKSQILVDASLSGEISDEELALAQTKKALAFLNSKIKEGTKEMKHIKSINTSINKIK